MKVDNFDVMKATAMRLRDLRPCDQCGGQLVGRMPDGTTSIQFYVLRHLVAAPVVDETKGS